MDKGPTIPIAAGDGDGLPREIELTPTGATSTGRARRARRARRASLLGALAVVVVGGLGAAALVASGGTDDQTDPDEALAAAEAAVDGASSFRFVTRGEVTMRLGDDRNGSDTTSRFTGTGSWGAPRWQATSGGELAVSETIVDGDTTYLRFAETADTLDQAQWERYETEPLSRQDLLDTIRSLNDLDEGTEANGGLLVLDAVPGGGGEGEDGIPGLDAAGFDDMMAVTMAESVYLGALDGPVAAGGEGPFDSGFAGDPGGFLQTIDRMADPRQVDEAGGITTLATTLEAPADIAEAFGGPFPDAEMELDVGADDLPTALRLDVAAGASSASIEIELSGWNEPVEITIPGGDQVDAHPLVDEQGLRRLTDLAPVWPTDPPDGWELTVYSPDETADLAVTEGDCETVELDWDELAGAADYLWLIERPLDCALAADPTPFRPGGPGGLPSRENPEEGTVEVQVGDTAVEVESTLDRADLDAVLRSLAPVDVETLISAV